MKQKRTGAQQNGCVNAATGEKGRNGDSQTLGQCHTDRFGSAYTLQNNILLDFTLIHLKQ